MGTLTLQKMNPSVANEKSWKEKRKRDKKNTFIFIFGEYICIWGDIIVEIMGYVIIIKQFEQSWTYLQVVSGGFSFENKIVILHRKWNTLLIQLYVVKLTWIKMFAVYSD